MENANDYNYAAGNSRRNFLSRGTTVILAGAAGVSLLGLPACKEEDEDDVTPPEDLMREHGVLNRVLLVYDHFTQQLAAGNSIDPRQLTAAAGIIKTFIEDYHEKQEEDFLFPRFEKAGKFTDLVATLRQQHAAGRQITGRLLQFGSQVAIESADDKRTVGTLLTSFNRMYRPHEAREDTVLFPAIRGIVSKHEFASLGEDFEKREHQLFGKEGFETFVEKIGHVEQQLGIYNLSQFTP